MQQDLPADERATRLTDERRRLTDLRRICWRWIFSYEPLVGQLCRLAAGMLPPCEATLRTIRRACFDMGRNPGALGLVLRDAAREQLVTALVEADVDDAALTYVLAEMINARQGFTTELAVPHADAAYFAEHVAAIRGVHDVLMLSKRDPRAPRRA